MIEIIIVTWNGREDTLRCVEAVARQRQSISFDSRITVVDNGSSDGTTEALLRRTDVRVLRLQENRGFTGGIRAAAEDSSADSLIFLNNDAVPEADWLDRLASAIHSAGPEVMAVGGRILDYSGERVDFSGGFLTFDGHAFQRDFHRPVEESSDLPSGSELLFACGGNMIVRRKPYLDLGGFDDDYFAYLEDVDFGWRSWLSGWRTTYEPRAVVRHRSSATSKRLGDYERGVLFERNALQTAIKNYEAPYLKEAAGPIFLTFLHRLYHYVMTRNSEVSLLRQEPFGSRRKPGNPSSRGFRHRLASWILGREAVVVDDPLTAMQFRALHWFFENQDLIMEKRRIVQSHRKVSDKVIFQKFPIRHVATYEGDHDLMSSQLFAALRTSLTSEDQTLDEILWK